MQATSDLGFIAVDLPEGRGDLYVWLGTTPVRTIASLVSIFSLLSLFALDFFFKRPVDGSAVIEFGHG